MSDQTLAPDLLIRGGTVLDPVAGYDGKLDIRVTAGKVAEVGPGLSNSPGEEVLDASGLLIIPGMIDTHAHVYQHVTGKFGLDADLVGVRSATTTLVDQGGPSCMTIGGFRHYVAEPSASRAICFISAYLVGGLEGHLYPELYGPNGVNVEHTTRAIEENRDIVKGIKAHAEIGGASRWGLEVIKLGKEISRQTKVPLYIHLGQLWPTRDGAHIDADELVRELVPLMEEGDILAHPFTRHPGGFVSEETGEVHPIIWEALERGVTVDVGHGSHFSFEVARRALDAGITPYTLGADMHGYNVSAPQPGMSDSEKSTNPFAGVAPFNLTVAMSELLAFGMPLADIVDTVCANPAAMLGMSDELGHLKPGANAEITFLEVLNGRFVLSDNSGVEVVTDRLIQPHACLMDGTRHEADSPFVPPPVSAAA